MKPSLSFPACFLALLALGAVACGDGAIPAASPEEERLGFEILEFRPDGTVRAWISPEITRAEFDALELPAGWFFLQPREGDPDSGRFLRSPDASADGEILVETFFGFSWFHGATVIEVGIRLEEEGLLVVSRVRKFHEVGFEPGSVVTVLLSPEGDAYFRIGRDANRTTDTPTIPSGWRLVEYVPSEPLVIQLFGETIVIRTDNQDSFQGPVPELAEAILAGGGG